MTIGKREQIVIGVLTALGLIAGLHMFIFAPSTQKLAEAETARNNAKGDLAAKIRIRDPKMLDKFEALTTQNLDTLDEGLKTLKIDEPEVFLMPMLEQVAPGPGQPPFPPPIPTPPKPNWRPGRGQTPWPTPLPPDKEPRHVRLKEIAMTKAPEQLKLILGEITKLRAAQAARRPELSFLGFRPAPVNDPTRWGGWRVPTELPAEMAGGALPDALNRISDYKNMYDQTSVANTGLGDVRKMYSSFTMKVGLDLEFNPNLRKYGGFVPLIQKLFFVDLIMKRAEAQSGGMVVMQKQLTALDLCNYLDANLDYTPLDGNTESKAYFLYEELRNLNYLIETARKMGVKNITEVMLRGYGFVKEFPGLNGSMDESIPNAGFLPDDESDSLPLIEDLLPPNYTINKETGEIKDPSGALVDPQMLMNMLTPGSMVMQQPGQTPLPTPLPSTVPKPTDLGYAVPIKISFITSNSGGIAYLYEILRDKPTSELHRLVMRSTAANWAPLTKDYSIIGVPTDPGSNDLEITATILFVPKLFRTIDEVRAMIKEIRGKTATSSTLQKAPVAAAPRAGAPGAATPAAGAPR